MKKLILLLSGIAMMLDVTSVLARCHKGEVEHVNAYVCNEAENIPVLSVDLGQWTKIPDVAQYKEADWSNVVGKAEDVTVEQAIAIAEKDPSITYFFYMKGYQMALENLSVEPPVWRIFHKGEAVFFRGEPWWGTAPGFSDGYIKKDNSQN